MQDRILAKDIALHVQSSITLCGWVHRIRELGGVSFILVRDRSGIAQVVYNGECPDIALESVVSITGKVEQNEKAPYGAELHEPTINIISQPQSDMPLAIHTSIDTLGLDTLLNNRILSLRIPKIRAIFEIQSAVLHCFETYMRKQDFSEIKSSKIISSGTEGGTGLFEVSYFDTKVFLAQSPQFYKQAAISSGLERVFEIGPVYRAEKHETNRHINEYVSLDIELAFIEDIDVLMNIQLGFLQYVSETILSRYASQLALWEASIPTPEELQKTSCISYDEAKAIASKESGQRFFDIDPKAERILCEWAKKTSGTHSIFISGFPRRKRPFYTMPDGQKTKGFDLLYGGVEISTGGLRIHDYSMLSDSAKKFGLEEEALSDYFSIFKYGCPPHGGWAIGLERLTQKILGISNVKLASMFPRDRTRISP